MYIENFSIHNIINFQLINRNVNGLLGRYTPEFEYFRTDTEVDLDFRISVSNVFYNQNDANIICKFRRQYDKWDVEIMEYNSGFVDLTIVPKLKGINKLVKYFSLKSIYIRSLIYYALIRKGGTLIHSSGINFNGKVCLFVGRPGVFKTTLLMNILRNTDATFMGEENTILYNGKIYPFPFHFRSLAFRLKHYKNENAQTHFHKYLQVFSLFLKNKINIPISAPAKLDTVFYVEKQEAYSCTKAEYSQLHTKFIRNELEELDIKCNHRLSAGIHENYFRDYLTENSIMKDIECNLSDIFQKELTDCSLYNLIMPKDYQEYLYKEVIKKITDYGD